ncbi:mitochondrial ribosomal protein l51 / s25 / CI-B8 domain-containing protein [Ditylenchus destructor]|uniref:NADH dehydrogenase [ubiquinone] 1 alpha subcomplex subunit 2 n=1 Tax=Ditylenchus destructor TaxID=166010 RepID=A0AAD4NGD4_9BILA|nr:mitochondrial ribosomal protein l51 / s25 / CI-B8 domain-containing protein [Ditylenchus destructor]
MASALRLAAGPLRELRIHLCQKSAESNGVREFILKDYATLKKNNPEFPILVRECSGVSPRIWARYDHGTETSVSVENSKREDVLEVVKKLASNKPS